MKNKANGPSDCLVTEMLQKLHMVSVHESAHRCEKRFKRKCRAPEALNVLRFVCLIKARRQMRKWSTIIPCVRIDECSFLVVHFGSCEITA